MEIFNLAKTSRRDFITKLIPTCSFMCSGGAGLLAGFCVEGKAHALQEKHMFDREFTRKLTHRQYVQSINRTFIEFAQAVQKKFGIEETIELIKKMATEWNLERGRKQAQNSKDRSLKSYTRMFADPKSWEPMLKIKIVEDSETAFELRVTECIQAAIHIDANAADIGYANVCWGDYAWAQGFNPKIKLIRDKTLMQGHACCNHRYVWIG